MLARMVSFEDFVAMNAAAQVMGWEPMFAQYRINAMIWSQIQNAWQPALMNPQYASFGAMVQSEVGRLRSGGAPKPVMIPPALYQSQAAQLDQGLEQGLNSFGNALASFGNAVGSSIDPSLAVFTPGSRVMVAWSDGNRYPATVMQNMNGQVQVAFPDGRQIWVPSTVVTMG